MDKFDLVQLIGNKTCAAANGLTQFVYGEQRAPEPKCGTWAPWWSSPPLIALVVLVIHQRRRDKLDY